MGLAYGNQFCLVTKAAKLYRKYEIEIEETTDKSAMVADIFIQNEERTSYIFKF